jgi:hypothetical protein
MTLVEEYTTKAKKLLGEDLFEKEQEYFKIKRELKEMAKKRFLHLLQQKFPGDPNDFPDGLEEIFQNFRIKIKKYGINVIIPGYGEFPFHETERILNEIVHLVVKLKAVKMQGVSCRMDFNGY